MMNRAALIGACVLLAGCTGGSQDDLKAWMDGQAKTMRGAVRPLPEARRSGSMRPLRKGSSPCVPA